MILVDTSIDILVFGNIINGGSSPGMTYGLDWQAGGGGRVDTANDIRNYVTAARLGTP